ncbi:hypothetical protein RRG08_066353 [Elysia crispata]|uniref:Uncharacterized protein n=1 Tax=Elysia crispata TaxID=231223 RepID=A0AAE0YAE1_9GAST|nr:hypothetical protein RRG08_066353 [Elysia crispata]
MTRECRAFAFWQVIIGSRCSERQTDPNTCRLSPHLVSGACATSKLARSPSNQSPDSIYSPSHGQQCCYFRPLTCVRLDGSPHE